MGILNICNIWVLLRIVIYLVVRKFHIPRLFAAKVDGSDIKRESVNMKTVLTSLPSTLTAQKPMKNWRWFGRQGILQFFLLRIQRRYIHFTNTWRSWFLFPICQLCLCLVIGARTPAGVWSCFSNESIFRENIKLKVC